MAEFITHQRQESGLPLGALGAGSVELRPDGEFHMWQIANPERWRQDCRKRPEADDGERLAGGLSFCLLAKKPAGETVLRRLGLGLGSGCGTEEYNYRMYSFLKPVEETAFDGTFPTASLEYRDRALPVQVRLKAASPFVPYDERTSGTPGIFLTFSVYNPSGEPVEISLTGKLRSLVNAGPEGRGQRNQVTQSGGYTSLVMSSGGGVPEAPDRGGVVLSAAGGHVTWLSGEYRDYMNEYVAHGSLGVSEESFLFALRRSGVLPDACVRERPDWREAAGTLDRLTAGEVDRLLEELSGHGFAASILERLSLADSALFASPETRREVLRYVLKNWSEMDRRSPWGDGALCVSFSLAPGERREIPFILSWYFPALYSAGGNRVGHMYENWFPDAPAVDRFLQRERSRILTAAERFVRTLRDTSFPPVFPDAVSSQLATLVKCSWWSREGEFGIWEGLGSCGLQTMDITYHASAALAVLFPALQMGQMRMSAAFQREDGCVPHFFSPDFRSVDEGFDRVDMNPQFVLLVCRDYLLTGDRAYAAQMWPHAVRAIQRTAGLDSSGGGLPDRDAGRNTYDAGHFSGTSAYVSILWLAALEAGALLAEVCGRPDLAESWRELARRGGGTLEERLWNGEYYDLWAEGARRDTSCMTDQLDGALFARAIGLEPVLPEDRVRSVLDAVWRYNYSEENGLVNVSCPPGKRATLHTFRNCQGLANWSGIEYLMAAFFIMEGCYDRGLRLVEQVWDRHLRLGQVWNHAECGDHYYRPLSSWWLLQALSGASVRGAEGLLLLSGGACEGPFRCPWFASSGYGVLDGGPGYRKLTCLYGRTELRGAAWTGGPEVLQARLNGALLPAKVCPDGSRARIAFDAVTLEEGSVLEISAPDRRT